MSTQSISQQRMVATTAQPEARGQKFQRVNLKELKAGGLRRFKSVDGVRMIGIYQVSF